METRVIASSVPTPARHPSVPVLVRNADDLDSHGARLLAEEIGSGAACCDSVHFLGEGL